jgi:hypothetical protein
MVIAAEKKITSSVYIFDKLCKWSLRYIETNNIGINH